MKTLLLILFGFITLAADTLDLQLKKYLVDKFTSYQKFDYEVTQLPKGFSRMVINQTRAFRVAKNYAYIPITVYDKKNIASESFLTVRIKLYKEVLVANDRINQNTGLDFSMFTTRLEDVSLFPDKTVDENSIVGKRSKVMIKSGSVLTSDMIEQVPEVYKGDKVVIHAGKDGVDISIEAISRQDGCIGDVISVQSNSRIFKAKVVDKFNLTLVE